MLNVITFTVISRLLGSNCKRLIFKDYSLKKSNKKCNVLFEWPLTVFHSRLHLPLTRAFSALKCVFEVHRFQKSMQIHQKTQWVNGQVVTRLKIEVRGSFPEEKESDWCLIIKTVSIAIIICRDTFFNNCFNFYSSNDYQKQVKYWFALRPKYMTQKYASIGLFAVDCFIYCFAEDNNSSNDNSNNNNNDINNSVTNVKKRKITHSCVNDDSSHAYESVFTYFLILQYLK